VNTRKELFAIILVIFVPLEVVMPIRVVYRKNKGYDKNNR